MHNQLDLDPYIGQTQRIQATGSTFEDKKCQTPKEKLPKNECFTMEEIQKTNKKHFRIEASISPNVSEQKSV